MAATARSQHDMQQKCKEGLAKATDPLEKLRLQCLSRGANGIQGLARQFKIIDDDGSKSLDIKEFTKGCHDFGADLTKDEIKQIFDRIDRDGSGSLDFDEFLESLRPPMSRARVNLINQAFQVLDKTKDGTITTEDLKGTYNCKMHPKFINGEMTEEEIFKEFLKKFEERGEIDGCVTKEEFLNYYSGVSASIDSDAYFDLMMRNAYKLK